MGELVDLKPASLNDNQEFISDMCRFQESIVTEKAIRKKYKFDEAAWEKLGNDDELVRAIEAESARRIRDGSAKREKSQLAVLRAPDVLSDILNDAAASPKHRIDSAKVLNDFSANGPAGVPAADRFSIVINLGADVDGKPIVEKYDRSIKVDVNDVDPNRPDDRVFPAIAMKKSTDDGNGEPL